eukprot:scaffold384164_cov35-Attheya_sp.AAC.1
MMTKSMKERKMRWRLWGHGVFVVRFGGYVMIGRYYVFTSSNEFDASPNSTQFYTILQSSTKVYKVL